MILRGLCCVLLAVLVSACAPRVEGLGPPIDSPRLADDAFIMADGYHLPVQETLPQDGPVQAVLVALHGFNDYAHAFAQAAPIWAKAGIAVYAYDQRGFGATQGRGLWHGTDAMVSDLASATQILRARYPKVPIAVLGESMGGAVTLAAIAADSLVPSMAHEMAVSRSVRGEFMDVVTNFFNSDMGSQEAVETLSDAIERAQL